jgi:DNA-binding NtrC family response regulator
MKGRILVVDDDLAMRQLLEKYLMKEGYLVTSCASGEEALLSLQKTEQDLVLTDLMMTGLNGLELCERIVGNYPELPVILLTAFGSLTAAIEAIRAGAHDFVSKPVELPALAATIERTLVKSLARKRSDRLAEDEILPEVASELIGDAVALQAFRKVISQVIHIDTPVLITGEAGTEKLIAAHLLHRESARASGPLVVVNCATLSASELETKLFGSPSKDADNTLEKGAFAQADGGVLVLNEISALSLPLQNRVFATLSDGFVLPNSAHAPSYSNFRLVTTSSLDLEQVSASTFSKELLSWLGAVRFTLPPLRERGSDILLLAKMITREVSNRLGRKVLGLTQAVSERLLLHSWPNNLEELKAVIESAVACATHEYLRVDDLPESMRAYKAISLGSDEILPNQLVPLDQVEQRHIVHVLKELGGNKAMAARVLGLDRRTLYRKLEQYGYTGRE